MACNRIEEEGGPLWQWDTGRRVRLPGGLPEGARAHFARDGSDEALVTVPEGGTAEVPNQLLTEAGAICCWAFDGERTAAWGLLPVRARAKPEGYLYTPTDVETVASLKEWVLAQIQASGGGLAWASDADIDGMFPTTEGEGVGD